MARTFTISEAAREAGVSVDTLRYYERAGLMLAPIDRASSGHRRYTERDVGWVVLVTKVRHTGMPIRRVRDYAALIRAGRGNEPQRLALLETHRDEVLERLRQTRRDLREIDSKIAAYRGRVAAVENRLADRLADDAVHDHESREEGEMVRGHSTDTEARTRAGRVGGGEQPVGRPDGRMATAGEIIAGHDLTGKHAVVTGGYSGVGYETVRALASAGASVVIAGRDPAKGADAASRLRAETSNKQIIFSRLDLGSLASVDGWAREFTSGGGPLHILVNNAAVMWPPQRHTTDGLESHLAINHLAHFVLTVRLLPALQEGGDSRVICLSSSGHRRSDIHYEDPNYDRRPYDPAEAYGQSKTANALFTVAFSTRYASSRLTANAVMPGGIRTGLMRHLSQDEFRARGWIDADGNDLRADWKTVQQGAATTIWAAIAPELQGLSGNYLEDCAIATPLLEPDQPLRGHYHPYALDPDNAQRLWTLSEHLIDSRP